MKNIKFIVAYIATVILVIAVVFGAAIPVLQYIALEKIFGLLCLSTAMMLCFVVMVDITVESWKDDNKYSKGNHGDTVAFGVLSVTMFLLPQVPIWIHIYSL